MLSKTRQQAWIHGLPGLDMKGGIPFETFPISTPKPDKHSLNFTLFGSKELISNLQSQVKSGVKIQTLSIVVRTNVKEELDNQYLMTGVVINSVSPVPELPEAQSVNATFDSISAKMGISVNPGPPANCPPILSTGANLGWVFGLPGEDIEYGKSIEVVDFSPPHYNRRLIITLGKQLDDIPKLTRDPIPTGKLILVLPDPTTQRYVEFKLWNANVSLMEDEQHVAFESDIIEWLTGDEA